ncbi:MAG: histidine kinase [Verrucomicrobiae bacterium]|nr:histidine kinase [Verrucomicrobiae bacterium]
MRTRGFGMYGLYRRSLWVEKSGVASLARVVRIGRVTVAAWFACVAAASAVAAEQAGFIIDVWGNEHGLPQSSVIAIEQTRDGYLWLGTLNGLVRFDGVRFKVYDEGNTPALGSSRIVYLFQDSSGYLWIGTEDAGVVLVKDGVLRPLDIGRGSRESRLVSACEDATGAVWLYTADGQLCRHKAGSVDVWRFGSEIFSACRLVAAEKAGPLWVAVDWGIYGFQQTGSLEPRQLPPLEYVIPAAKVDYVLASRAGGYWLLADGRVQKWFGNRLERDFGPYPWKPTARVSAACEDPVGNLVVGTLNENDGVYWFGPDGRAEHISSKVGLSHDGVLSLRFDREGNLWVGTDGGGLNRIRRRSFYVAAASRGWVVQSVYPDAQGALWMGFNAGGVTYWRDGFVRDFGAAEGLTLNPLPGARPNFWTVFVDRDQRVWVGTRGDGLFQFMADRFEPVEGAAVLGPHILAIHQDRAGRLWFGTENGVGCFDGQSWSMYTTQHGLSANAVRAIADDPAGNVWLGTVGGGLNCFRDGRFTWLRRTDGLPSDNVTALMADPDGVLWVGTGNGLVRLQGTNLVVFTTEHGLAANSVSYIVEDTQGCLWIGSNAGLTRVCKRALEAFASGRTNFVPMRVYGRADGLPTSECTAGSQPAACRTPDGRLWFPTVRGLVWVDPARLVSNTNAPYVIIESVLVDGREQSTNEFWVSTLEHVVVPPGRERIEIFFTAVGLTAPERVRFRYRLEGHEHDWVELRRSEAGQRPFARYSRVPPGQYRFVVKACNEDGVWNETGAVLGITVPPPFWRTWWFTSLSVLALLAVVGGAVHFFSAQRFQRQLALLRQREAVERERARIARDLHDQLGASLAQMALLGELAEEAKDSPAKVEAHARQISSTARETARALDEIVWATNPAYDTLEGLAGYTSKYAQEYLANTGVRLRIEMPAALPQVEIPPEVRHNVFLAVKEALTNVVKHARATEVLLRLYSRGNVFVLEVQDNGCGLPPDAEARGRNGLKNMRRRLEELGGVFVISPGSSGGTVARFEVPMGREG